MRALRVAVLILASAFAQLSVVGSGDVAGVAPDLLLVVLVLAAWHRGAIAGAWAGFVGGLVIDTVTLGQLGVTSLLLTLVGYWAGRYAETTGRGRAYAPYLAVLVLTIAFGVAGLALNALLGETVDTGHVFRPLVPAALLNVGLALLVHRPCRWWLRASARPLPPAEAEPVG